LIGDTTYVDGGLRIIRGDTGANAYSQIIHRGTGTFSLVNDEVAGFEIQINNTMKFQITSAGLVQGVNSETIPEMTVSDSAPTTTYGGAMWLDTS
jgi:hypothetical protein